MTAPFMKPLPQSPDELRDALTAIFPSFAEVLEESEGSEFEGEPVSFHGLMREFAYFFGKNIDSFSDSQLRQFADLVVQASKKPGDLENAIDTCFLEHTRQLKVNRQLAPWLAKARAKHGA